VPENGLSDTSKPRRRLGRDETTARILDAAEELFSTHNPTLVTVRDVAEKAGVSHALVHQYVGTKDDLLNAVIQRAAPDRQRTIGQVRDVRQVIPALVDDVLERRLHSRSVLRSAMDGIEYVSLKERITTGGLLIELGQEATSRGLTRRLSDDAMDIRIVLAGTVAMAYGWAAADEWLLEIFDLKDDDPEAVRAHLLELASAVVELMFPAEEDAGPPAKGDAETVG